jgi:hypothetical protein
MNVDTLLAGVPDISDSERFKQWMTERLAALGAGHLDAKTLRNCTPVVLPAADPNPVLGAYGSPRWRRFAAAIFLADWACYANAADRADFDRLLYVLACFPAGFRLWMGQLPNGEWTPVGYTGWYPIAGSVFDVLCSKPGSITHRGFMGPLRELHEEGNYLYLFNASIIPHLRQTEASRLLLRRYLTDVAVPNVLGMAAVTVSKDGARIAQMLGLQHVGDMTFAGEAEYVYAVRFEAGAG